jgi:hypothetical protein
MNKTTEKQLASKDLNAAINQSTANKLLNSTVFPLLIVNTTNPPPGVLITTESVNEDEIILSKEAVANLLKEIMKAVDPKSTRTPGGDVKVYSEALSNLSQTIESAKAFLRAKKEAESTVPPTPFEGPDPAYVQSILDNGIEGLANIQGIEFKVICSKLQVIADNKPTLTLNGPNISVSNSKITTNATAELWWYHPTLHCSRFCTNWSITWGWDRIASASASVRVDFDGYASVIVNGKVLFASLHINKLRLDYPILREIPLEGIANRVLANKQIPIFDAGNFIASIPIINSRFVIDGIYIPVVAGGIEIDIEIKQI